MTTPRTASVGGRRRHEPVHGIDRDRGQLAPVADHDYVAGTRHRQSGQQEVDLRSLIDDEVVEQVPVSVTRDQVRSFRTPMLVLPGADEPHPTETEAEEGR